jgi:fructokinase
MDMHSHSLFFIVVLLIQCIGCCDAFLGGRRQHYNSPFWSSTTHLQAGNIVCVGEVLYDCIATDKARGWSVEELVDSGEWSAFPGGANANVATAFSKLTGSAAFVGCVGDDEDGRALTTLLEETGVDVSLMHTCQAQPTRRIIVTRSVDGEREFGGFWGNRKAWEFADAYMQADKLVPSSNEVLQRADWIVCGTLGLAFDETTEAVEALLKHRSSSTCLFVDVNWRQVIWNDTVYTEDEIRIKILDFIKRHGADAVKLTDEEAEWLFGISAKQALDEPSSVHSKFPHAMAVFVTAGEKGASYSIQGCTGYVAPYQVKVTETTGAGDAFSAGFLYRWINDDIQARVPTDRAHEIHQMVQFASAVGALTCTREGAIAAQPTLSEVETFLETVQAS